MTRFIRTILLCISLAIVACGGYMDVPIQERERATLMVESVDLYPGAIGTVQVVATVPEGAEGPLWLMSPPVAIAPTANVSMVGYHLGPCHGDAEPDDEALRICLAVFCPANQRPDGLQVALVADSRTELRRWTFSAEVSLP